MEITLFLWDQIFMKINKNKNDIFKYISISLVCLKNDLLATKDWDGFLKILYNRAK
jgi:hypothetical protein